MSCSSVLVSFVCVYASLPFAASTFSVASPDNALPTSYDGYCNTQFKGYKSRSIIILPNLLVPAHQKDYKLDIPDKCAEQKMELVGGVVTACDTDAAPTLQLPSMAVGYGLMSRQGALNTTAHCYAKLYCI